VQEVHKLVHPAKQASETRLYPAVQVKQTVELEHVTHLSEHLIRQSSPENPEKQEQIPETHFPNPEHMFLQGTSRHSIFESGQVNKPLYPVTATVPPVKGQVTETVPTWIIAAVEVQLVTS
jgi:hypothetical protein